MTTKRKIIAIVTAFSVWASTAAPALALTAAELQTQIDALMAQLATLQAQLSGLEDGGTTTTVCTITSFTRNLKQGMSGDDAKCLQIVLNLSADTKVADSGVGSPGSETSYFGPLTKAAVIKFQEKYASDTLAPWGLTSGTGFVGSTTRAKLDTFLTGGGVTPPDGEVGTAATVSLASDTPSAAQVALASQEVTMTKIKFTAGATAYTVTQLVIARGGVSADADVASIQLYDGATQLGSTQALNTNTHKATFSSLSWTVPSYGVKYLTIKVNIAASGTATVGDSIQLGIASAAGIVASVTPSGVFPMMGNARTIAGISVGGLNVDAQASPATTTILSGATDQEIACWRFTASTTEGFDVHSIKISHSGTAAVGDVSNIKLKVGGAQVGPTLASLDSTNAGTFDLSGAPLNLIGGGSKNVCAYADIAAGIWTARTLIFEITQYNDVVAYGTNSGGVTTIGSATNLTFFRQHGSTMTVGQGALSVALDAALNPSSQSYVKGTSNRLMTAIKFSTGSQEGARIVKIRLTLTGVITDISNVTLWDGTNQIAGPSSAIGGFVIFGASTVGWDTTGLFDLEKSSTKTILVKADIPTGATATNEITLSLASASDVWADGLASQYDIAAASITVTSVTGNAHTIAGNGALAVSLAADTPASQTYVKGSTAKVLAKINLTAGSGEDVVLSSITVRCYRSNNTGTACSAGDIASAKLMKSDGTQFGATIASPVATLAFSGNMTIVAATTETVSVVADVPTGSGATSTHVSVDETGTTVATDLITTGVSSGADITETGAATGKLMVFGQGGLTISAAATPGDQTLIIGAAQVPIVNLVFTAGTGEDIRITRILLRRMCETGNNCVAGDLSNIALYDGATILTVKKAWDSTNATNTTFTASDFLNSSGIDISKGQQKNITAKGDFPSTATAGNDFSLGIATSTDPGSTTTTDVTFVGLQSNTTPAPTVTKASTNLEGANWSSYGHADASYVSLLGSGVLTVAASADTPVEAIQSVSIEGVRIPNVAFLKVYLAATLEAINIKSITIERTNLPNSRDSDFDSIALYDGNGTLLTGAQSLATASTTFNLVPDDGDGVWEQGEYWLTPSIGANYLIVKATLNGIRGYYGYGSETGDEPKLCIDNVTAEGLDSGVSPTGAGTLDICGNAQMIRQTKPTLALASPGTGTYGAGTKELIRWTVTADATSDVKWKKVIFDVSGSVTISTVAYTVGSYPDSCGSTNDNGVYMSTSTTCGGAVATQLIASSSMQVWDAGTNTQIISTTTGNQFVVDQSTATGTARVAFVAATEQTVGAGQTKTYYLQGNILSGGSAGDNLLTRIAARSTATTTGIYATVAAGTGTFIWADNSGASAGAHSAISADWTHDYKVPGIPTSSWTLSK